MKAVLIIVFVAVAILMCHATVHAQSICDRLRHIRTLPFKGESGVDPDYDLLIKAGRAAIPCLIRNVSDSTVTRDPRTEPGYAGIRVRLGDVAYFVLADIAKTPFIELMPARVQKQWKEFGVGAYFYFVRTKKNREWFRHKLEAWYKGQEATCLMTTSQLQTFFGFRLGMKLSTALEQFREFPSLNKLEQGELIELTFNDETGRKAVHAWAKRECCVVIEDYRRLNSRRGGRFSPTKIDLTFWAKQLKGLVIDFDAADWTPTSFVADLSERFGFQLQWWRSQPTDHHDQRWVKFDKGFSFDCDSFRATAYCFPAPTDLHSADGQCRLALEDLRPVVWKTAKTEGR